MFHIYKGVEMPVGEQADRFAGFLYQQAMEVVVDVGIFALQLIIPTLIGRKC